MTTTPNPDEAWIEFLNPEQQQAARMVYNLPPSAAPYILGFLAVEVPEAFVKAVTYTRPSWEGTE